MSVSQTKLIEISEQSLNWIFQKGMRFILILFQQFKYRPFLGWTWLKPSNRIIGALLPSDTDSWVLRMAVLSLILRFLQMSMQLRREGTNSRSQTTARSVVTEFMEPLIRFNLLAFTFSAWFVTRHSESNTAPALMPFEQC